MKRLLLLALALVACHRVDSGRDLSSVDAPAMTDAAEPALAYSIASVPKLAAFTPTPGCCAASSTGSATGANQVLEIAQLTAINGKLPPLVGGRVPVDVGTVSVTGGLTDTQLRASAVPISAASLPLPTLASTSTLQSSANTLATAGNVSLASIDAKTPALSGGAVPVTGPLTDAQLRATAVPVSGPATDAQLRASPLPVSGTVTITPSGTLAVSSASSS